LAVGSKARPAPWPGAEGRGLHYFVTLRDLEGLDRAARPGQHAVVVGGGLIGVEGVEILLHPRLKVTVAIREDWYFPPAPHPPRSEGGVRDPRDLVLPARPRRPRGAAGRRAPARPRGGRAPRRQRRGGAARPGGCDRGRASYSRPPGGGCRGRHRDGVRSRRL